MIVWLASYPRSGNTLLRMVLKEAFGKFTYSEYNDRTDIGGDKALAHQVNHVSYPMSWDEFYRLASDKPKLHLVKTHGPPKDDAPCIYMLRDGRAACVSYVHYLESYGKRPATLRDVILGAVEFGSWSRHVEDWRPETRPNTLLLRFEDLIDDLPAAIRRIADFLQLPIKGDYTTSFDSLHAKFPAFFRAGKRRADPATFDAVDRSLFDLLHGPTMSRFGYGDPGAPDQVALRSALIDAGADRKAGLDLKTREEEVTGRLQAKYKEIGGLNARLKILEAKLAQTQHLRETLLGDPLSIWRLRRHLKRATAKNHGVLPTAVLPRSLVTQDPSAAEKAPLGIALFGFDRGQLVENVLESLDRQGRIGDVHLWIDGDQGNPTRRKKTEAVHQIGRRYGVKKIHGHRGNLGFRKMMLQAMAYMSLHYDKIVFLEDDCFPTKRCIEVFEAELEKIRDQEDVFSVYGHHFDLPNEGSYFPRFQGWGWATTASKLRPVLSDLTQCFLMTEERFLAFTADAMTPPILRQIDVTPGRQPSTTLKAFFAWDETLCLLTALRGQVHKKSVERVIYNCGAGGDATHFAEVDWFRKPPFNMIAADEVWDYF